jgi:polo-like kinase 4
MANQPSGDIELLFQNISTNEKDRHDFKKPHMRMRLSRATNSLEIARSSQKEWSKKTLLFTGTPSIVSTTELEALSIQEAQAIARLTMFLKLCQTFEGMNSPTSILTSESHDERENDRPNNSDPKSLVNSNSITSKRHEFRHSYDQKENTSSRERIPETRRTSTKTTDVSWPQRRQDYGPELESNRRLSQRSQPRIPTSSSLTKVLSACDISDRPRKFSATPTTTSSILRKPLQDKNFSIEACKGQTAELNSQYLQMSGNASQNPEVQSKFLSGIGWCIRQNSAITQGGRYKVMFTTGSIMEVDVDEEWMSYVPLGKKPERYAFSMVFRLAVNLANVI